jgi:hypothetical protein
MPKLNGGKLNAVNISFAVVFLGLAGAMRKKASGSER